MLRRCAPNPEVVREAKLLFLTTHSNAAYAEEAFKAGGGGYVVKHAALSELPIAIAALLEGHQNL
jgi:DNA-binding NarL/FixJ family response regulator